MLLCRTKTGLTFWYFKVSLYEKFKCSTAYFSNNMQNPHERVPDCVKLVQSAEGWPRMESHFPLMLLCLNSELFGGYFSSVWKKEREYKFSTSGA